MDSKTLKIAILGFVVIMGVMTNKATAGFGDCYSNCVETCAPPGDASYAKCPFTCLSKCWSNPNPIPQAKSVARFSQTSQVNNLDPSGFCILRCAMHTCADSLNDSSKVQVCLQKCADGFCKF